MSQQNPHEDEHIILVAISVTGCESRDAAQDYLIHQALPRPDDRRSEKVASIDSWWIAEDDRRDGSDTDSAVFITGGYEQRKLGISGGRTQEEAARILDQHQD